MLSPDKNELISIKDAEAQGITRVRKPVWANPLDQLHIGPGIWTHLYCPFNKECNGRDPVDMLKFQIGDLDAKEWLPHTGSLPDSEEYKAAVAVFDGCLSNERKQA